MTTEQQAPIAPTGNWPLPEDRKAAVVATDVARGILTEEQARAACRGEGSPTARIDTPFREDPLVGGLAAEAERQTKQDVEEFVPQSGDLDPTRDGEAGARSLDSVIAGAPAANSGLINAEDVQQGNDDNSQAGGTQTDEERVAELVDNNSRDDLIAKLPKEKQADVVGSDTKADIARMILGIEPAAD